MGKLVREDLSEEVTLGWDLSDEKVPDMKGGVKGGSKVEMNLESLRNIKANESRA